MPFERQFDEARVLDDAMRAFWARGFEATSVGDLVEATGLQRGSLYAAYSDKRGLFLAALRHYDEIHRQAFLSRIAHKHSARDRILVAFKDAARKQRPGTPPGCLLVNTALELSPHDPEIRAIVQASFDAVEAFFAESIAAGQAEGSIPRTLNPAATAKALLGLFLGLRVATRAGSDPAVAGAITAQAAAMLT